MEKRLNKFDFEKLLAFATIALSCVCMWGCSDDETFEWDKLRGNAKIVGFIDDSLVMVGDYRFWHETTEGWNGDYREDTGVGNPRLCVYNYRVQEDGPRWCDSLSELNSPGWFGGQLTDSVIWGGDVAGKLKIWKVGGNPHEIGITKSMDNCTKEFRITSVKQWLDGMFIAKSDNSLKSGGSDCQYAVLDTIERKLTYKRLDKRLEWINQCDDVKAWGMDVYCLYFDVKDRSSSLFINGNIMYKLENDYFWTAGAKLMFQGYILLLERDVCRIVENGIECFATASSNEINFKNKLDNTYIAY